MEEKKSTEELLLLLPKQKQNDDDERRGIRRGMTWELFREEAKKLSYIAGPMVAVNLALYMTHVTSMMLVGHLGELSLSSAAIAISLCSVTGFSLLSGMASALETLCGQAYGAQQYRKVGNQTYGAIFSLIMVSLLLSLVWINMEKLFLLMGQDPLIAYEAGRYTKLLIPCLFAYATFQPLLRYFQTQSLILPMIVSALATLLVHVPLCWFLVYKSGLRNLGGAVAASVSSWINVILLVLYMKYSPACAKTRVVFSVEIFHEVGEFFRFAIPSTIMICLQWWSYEFVILISGLLPNAQLETSVLSICLTSIATLAMIPNGISAGVSTRVSNELGAGNPDAARVSAYSTMCIAVAELLLVGGALFVGRGVFGYSFSDEKEVVDYVSSMAPLVCLAVITDGSQSVLSGVARGCGWQHIGAYVNLASLYLCGVPAAAILGFWLEYRARGLWLGIQLGAVLQAILLAIVTGCTNWETQATKARERIFQSKDSVANVLV